MPYVLILCALGSFSTFFSLLGLGIKKKSGATIPTYPPCWASTPSYTDKMNGSSTWMYVRVDIRIHTKGATFPLNSDITFVSCRSSHGQNIAKMRFLQYVCQTLLEHDGAKLRIFFEKSPNTSQIFYQINSTGNMRKYSFSAFFLGD